MNLKRKFMYATAVAISIAISLAALTAKALGLSQESATTVDSGSKYIGAGLAIGLAGLGSAVGMGTASAAAIGAISENEELFGTSLIFIVLIEAVAIYGLLISLLLMFAV